MPVLLRKDEKGADDLKFISQAQIDSEMDALLEHYGAIKSQADLYKTRKTLKRFGSVTEELAAMREEKR